MNKILPLFILLFAVVDFTDAQTTTIPDANLEQALIDMGIDSDGVINGGVLTADISSITDLDVSFNDITDLTGIEDFTALQNLSCFNNSLTALDVSSNLNLIELYCDSNQLTSLNVSANTNLTTLWCQFNQLTDLNVNGATSLLEIYCLTNQLASFDVSGATSLQLLYCPDNLLTSLELGDGSNLVQLYCFDNLLTDIDVSSFSNLTVFWCYNNSLTGLDVSSNTNLTNLLCNDNQLTGSLLLNGLSFLTTFDVTINPDLTCIQVDNETDADSGLGQYSIWLKDVAASYSENCVLYAEDFAMGSAVTVYPNPASHEIHLVLPYEMEKAVLYNLQGQKILESKSETINIENLSEGLYFIIIQTVDNRKLHRKILVSPPP